jgi:hypothetical protein
MNRQRRRSEEMTMSSCHRALSDTSHERQRKARAELKTVGGSKRLWAPRSDAVSS